MWAWFHWNRHSYVEPKPTQKRPRFFRLTTEQRAIVYGWSKQCPICSRSRCGSMKLERGKDRIERTWRCDIPDGHVVHGLYHTSVGGHRRWLG